MCVHASGGTGAQGGQDFLELELKAVSCPAPVLELELRSSEKAVHSQAPKHLSSPQQINLLTWVAISKCSLNIHTYAICR